MTNPNSAPQYTEAQYDRADQLVDTRQISYTEALQLASAELPAMTSREQARAKDHAYYEQEFHLTGDEPLTPKEIETNRQGRKLVEDTLAKVTLHSER